jgi:hypothetical protein
MVHSQKLALASLTSGGCSVGIVRLRTTSHGVSYGALHEDGLLRSNDVGVLTTCNQQQEIDYIYWNGY